MQAADKERSLGKAELILVALFLPHRGSFSLQGEMCAASNRVGGRKGDPERGGHDWDSAVPNRPGNRA